MKWLCIATAGCWCSRFSLLATTCEMWWRLFIAFEYPGARLGGDATGFICCFICSFFFLFSFHFFSFLYACYDLSDLFFYQCYFLRHNEQEKHNNKWLMSSDSPLPSISIKFDLYLMYFEFLFFFHLLSNWIVDDGQFVNAQNHLNANCERNKWEIFGFFLHC